MRQCLCNNGEIETPDHVLLCCPFYKELRSKLILPLTDKYPGRQDIDYMHLLLIDKYPTVTAQVARFCAAAMKIRQAMIGKM